MTINGTNLKVNSNNVEFWAAVMPATVKSLNIVVETNKATYTRNIESCNIEFKQNARKGLNVDMSSVERVEKSAGLALPFDEDFNAVKSTNNWENLEIAKFPNFSDFKTVRSYKIDGAIIIGTGSAKGSVSTADVNLSKASHVIIRAQKYSKDNVAISMTAGGKTYTTAKLGETFQDYSINLPALSSTEKITITSDINGRLYIDRIQIIEGNFAELSINPEYQSVESSATSTTFSVLSNTKWTVSTTSDWAKVSTQSGENNGEVEITFSENATDKERTANIVVTTEDDSITKTFALTQKAVASTVGPIVLYTLNPVKGKNSDYTKSGDVKIDGITWCVGGNNMTIPWRIGGKNITKVDRALYSKTAYPKALTSIKVTFGTSNITVNSCKLVYSANADFTDSKERNIQFTASSTVEVTDNFPANAYYKLVFNVTNTTNNNKSVQLSKIEFLGLDN